MTRRVANLFRVTACLLVATAIAYATLYLAWSPTPRLVVGIMPGAYIAVALNKLLRLDTNGSGFLYLFFASHLLFWFALLLGSTWGGSKAWSRWHQAHGTI